VETDKTEDKMRNYESIKISHIKALDNKLKVELVISKKIAKYFLKNSFEVYYDKNIENVGIDKILSLAFSIV